MLLLWARVDLGVIVTYPGPRHRKYTTKTFKCIEIPKYRIHEIGSGTKLYYLWVKRFFDMRDTSFSADCFYIVSSQPNQRAAPVAHKFVWPRPALNLDSLVRWQELNSLLFLKSPNPQPTLPVRDVTHIPWDFYFDISGWHILSACAWTPALMLHLTNPCTKRKVLILTKPKGKIYKTKSLRHYITRWQ